MNKRDKRRKKRIDRNKLKPFTIYRDQDAIPQRVYITDKHGNVDRFFDDEYAAWEYKEKIEIQNAEDDMAREYINEQKTKRIEAELEGKTKRETLGGNYNKRRDMFDKSHKAFLEAQQAIDAVYADYDPDDHGSKEEYVKEYNKTGDLRMAEMALDRAIENLQKDAAILKSIERNAIADGKQIEEGAWLEDALKIVNPEGYEQYQVEKEEARIEHEKTKTLMLKDEQLGITGLSFDEIKKSYPDQFEDWKANVERDDGGAAKVGFIETLRNNPDLNIDPTRLNEGYQDPPHPYAKNYKRKEIETLLQPEVK